jgi:ABC-type amino acid transport substrate-binding protein
MTGADDLRNPERTMVRHSRIPILALLVSALFGSFAAGQIPVIPPDYLHDYLRLQGDQLTFCVLSDRSTTEFDVAVAEAISATLLLTSKFVSVPADFPLFDENDFFYEIYLRLTNDCDAFVGFSLMSEGYPDWLSASDSYISLPFALVVTNPDYRSLGDIPTDKAIGLQMGGTADMQFLAYYTSLADRDRWTRLPYGSDELMLRRLKEDTIQAAILWLPNLLDLTDGDPEAAGFFPASTAPLRSFSVQLGLAFRGDNSYLQAMFDSAIESLKADGTIEDLAREFGVMLP